MLRLMADRAQSVISFVGFRWSKVALRMSTQLDHVFLLIRLVSLQESAPQTSESLPVAISSKSPARNGTGEFLSFRHMLRSQRCYLSYRQPITTIWFKSPTRSRQHASRCRCVRACSLADERVECAIGTMVQLYNIVWALISRLCALVQAIWLRMGFHPDTA